MVQIMKTLQGYKTKHKAQNKAKLTK